jgi:hypothetical protein
MSVCVHTNYLDPRSFYPVPDPRRTAGSGRFAYGYALAWDAIAIYVERSSELSSCQMRVVLETTLHEAKEIQAWNLFADNFVDRVGTSAGLEKEMVIRRAWGPGRPCGGGTDTLVLCRYFAWPRGRTALYCFPPKDLWDFWGGCTVTFSWVNDTVGSGLWGNQTPDPIYPIVRLPDRTLMNDGANFRVVFGGTDFTINDPTYIAAMGLDTNTTVPFIQLKATPVDFTLVREQNRPEIYVVYGGAKFWIPDPPTLFRLGFDWSRVSVIPPGGAAKLGTMPIDGTLLMEEHEKKVFLTHQSALRWVISPASMDSNCLAWRHVRIVPDGSLATLARGPHLAPAP